MYFRLLFTIIIISSLTGCERSPNYSQEIIELQKTAQRNPKDIQAYKDLIKKLFESEYYKDSLKYSEALLKISPDDYFGMLYCGLSNENLKKWDIAEEEFKEICDRYLEESEGYYRLALLQYKMGQYKDCISNIEKTSAMGPPDTSLYIEMMDFLSVAYYYNNETANAYSTLDKILELDPFNKNALYYYGVFLLREGKYKDSIEYLNKLIAQNPQEEFPYLRLAKAYYHSHEMDKAEEAFWNASRFDSTVKILAEIVHVQDMYSTHKDINTAMIKVNEKYDYRYGEKYYVRGIIENMGLEMAQWVTVIVRFYDKKDNLIEQKVFDVSPKNIRPEQYTFFNIDIPYNDRITGVKIDPNWHKRSTSIYLK